MYAQCQGSLPQSWAGDYVQAPSRRGAWCGVVIFLFLLFAGLWWVCAQSPPSERLPVLEETIELSAADEVDKRLRASKNPELKTLYGDMMRGCSDPKVAASSLAQRHPDIIGGATVPLDVAAPRVASIGGLNLPGSVEAGTALSGAFDLSEPGKEYLAAYNPRGLASVMPAGWRADAANPAKCASTGDGSYAEFSRYSISPEAVARSENMKSVLRLSENTRQGLGRALGYQSLLRNYVTPVGPQPIGDKSMLFNDSSVRQSYIAAVTGSFPDLGLC